MRGQRLLRRVVSVPMWMLLACCSIRPVWTQPTVATGQYDNGRTGTTTSELVLRTNNVNGDHFGKLFSRAVDGYIYAQPLYVPAVTIPGHGVHNVVYVATMHNTIYAFDAEDPSASEPLWKVSLGPSVPHGAGQILTVNSKPDCVAGGTEPVTAAVAGGTTLTPEIGILGTPVIDPASQTLYAVAATLQNNDYCHKLYAIDIATGTLKAAPIQASVPGHDAYGTSGTVTFASCRLAEDRTWIEQLQRPALLLSNGIVHVAFSVFGNPVGSPPPWHGWVIGYDAATLAERVAFNSTPRGGGGGIGHSGRGVAADPQGSLYAVTGVGDFDGRFNLSDSILRLSGVLSVQGRFTPARVDILNENNLDLSSGGPLVIPGSKFVIAGSEEGFLYSLNTDTMQLAESFKVRTCGQPLSRDSCYQIHHYSYWNGPDGPTVYVWSDEDTLKAFRFDVTTGLFQHTPASQTGVTAHYPGGVLAVSSYGSEAGSGIVWATLANGDSESETVPGVLRAYRASDLSQALWNSEQNPARDRLGSFARFAVPTVANGRVYVATLSGSLVVYGLLDPSGYAPPPTIQGGGIVNGASFLAPLSAGSFAAIFGKSFSDKAINWDSAIPSGSLQLPASLNGLQVQFGGKDAYVRYVSPGQVNVLLPPDLPEGAAKVKLTTPNGTAETQVLISKFSPAFFTYAAVGKLFAVALFANEGVYVGRPDNLPGVTARPAKHGDYLELYLTGMGPTDPPYPAGTVLTTAYPIPASVPVTVTFGDQQANVTFAGMTFAGVFQVNVQVPETVPQGVDVPLTLEIGGESTQPRVFVSIGLGI